MPVDLRRADALRASSTARSCAAILDVALDGIFIVDEEDRITEFNQRGGADVRPDPRGCARASAWRPAVLPEAGALGGRRRRPRHDRGHGRARASRRDDGAARRRPPLSRGARRVATPRRRGRRSLPDSSATSASARPTKPPLSSATGCPRSRATSASRSRNRCRSRRCSSCALS